MNKIIKLSDDDYFASERLSNSFLVRFDRSPMHAMTEIKTTSSMELGKLLHKFILEEDLFYTEYKIAPENIIDARKKEYKEFAKQNENKKIVMHQDYSNYTQIKHNVLNYKLSNNKTFEYFLLRGKIENAIFWDCLDLQCKGKPDLFCTFDDTVLIFDIKSCTNCLDFSRSISKFQYYRQYAMYRDGIEIITGIEKIVFIFLAFETVEPFGVQAFILDDDYIDFGRKRYTQSILNYKKWVENGSNPTLYEPGLQTVYKPNYLE